MKEIGRNDKYVFYLEESSTDWCRYECLMKGIKSQNWHVVVVLDTKGVFQETLIINSETNDPIASVPSMNLESIGSKIDVLKLANV